MAEGYLGRPQLVVLLTDDEDSAGTEGVEVTHAKAQAWLRKLMAAAGVPTDATEIHVTCSPGVPRVTWTPAGVQDH